MSEKARIARFSAIASAVLTALKLSVGIMTGSLALTSEGIHSLLDFLATLVTWISVRTSDRPADEQHHYGHGKLENLSAFGESIMLVMTGFWIVNDATARLIAGSARNGVMFHWAILVIVISIAVDVSRSIALSRAAKKYASQALEADALHFTTELFSSGLVLLALILVQFGGRQFWWADPAAAIGVALVMIYIACRLAKRSADILVDRAPAGLEKQMQELIRRVPGVHDVPRVRTRQSGAATFVDATIKVDPNVTLQGGHEIASCVELAVTEAHPHMDITVHVEPAEVTNDDADVIRELAHGMGLALHALRIREISSRLYVNFHVELPAQMQLAEAHKKVTDLEERIRLRIPQVAEIDSHLEPASTPQ
jgi:cation diffusion facilitator family transporter